MFKTVMSNEERLRELLRRILPEIKIDDLEIIINEMSLELEPEGRGIRLDIMRVMVEDFMM